MPKKNLSPLFESHSRRALVQVASHSLREEVEERTHEEAGIVESETMFPVWVMTRALVVQPEGLCQRQRQLLEPSVHRAKRQHPFMAHRRQKMSCHMSVHSKQTAGAAAERLCSGARRKGRLPVGMTALVSYDEWRSLTNIVMDILMRLNWRGS